MEPDFDFEKVNFGGGPTDDPAPKSTTAKKTTSRSVGRPSKTSKANEIRNELESIMKLALLPLFMRDIHVIEDDKGNIEYYSCANVYLTFDEKQGTVLTSDGKRLCEAMAAVVVDSPFLMKMLTMGDEFGKWVGLALALQPFAMTIFTNHIAHRKLDEHRED